MILVEYVVGFESSTEGRGNLAQKHQRDRFVDIDVHSSTYLFMKGHKYGHPTLYLEDS